MPEPLMRASHIRSNLEALRDLGESAEARIRASCGDVTRALEESVSVAWLPLGLDVKLTMAVHDVCGPASVNPWSRNALAKSGDGPLMRPILVALARVGLTPALVLKRVSYGWALVYRNCGEVSYEAGTDSAALVLRGAPELMRGDVYLSGIAGAFEGLMGLAGRPRGLCEVRLRKGDEVRFACRW